MQHGNKENYCNLTSFNWAVNTKTSIIQTGLNVLNIGLKMYLNRLKISDFFRIPSLISKERNENIICTIDDVRVDFLGPPHGTTPAAVIANKEKSVIL